MRNTILRTFLFVVFFSIGAAALSCSILCNDLLRYYRNKQLLKTAEVSLNQLESLNTDYDALLQQLQKDPNFVRRIAPATLGTEPEDADAIYPKATGEQLAVARRVMTKEPDQEPAEPVMPGWLTRCSEPFRRTMMFFSGGALILISFICFGPAKHIYTSKKQQ